MVERFENIAKICCLEGERKKVKRRIQMLKFCQVQDLID
jgi:hypothetical protein